MRVILLNAFSVYHVGCGAVQDTLMRLAGARGMEITRHDDRIALPASARCDLVIVNGEGTYHHESPRAMRLHAMAGSLKARGARTALVNATIQDIALDFTIYDEIAVRESRSADYVRSLFPKAGVQVIPDAAFCHPAKPQPPLKRSGVLFMDSVVGSCSRVIESHAATLGETVMRLCHWKGSADDMIGQMRQKELVVTGRFHGAALAMLSGTPLLTLPSNTWKMEGMMNDFGILHQHCATAPGLADALAQPPPPPVDLAPMQIMEKWERLFDKLATMRAAPAAQAKAPAARIKRVQVQAPPFIGDEVVFTGAVREVQRRTGWAVVVKTRNPELWVHHPHVESVNSTDLTVDCTLADHHCPAFRRYHEIPGHFLEHYVRRLCAALRVNANFAVSKFAGEVPVGIEEKAAPPFGLKAPYWLIAPGCKSNEPVKNWGTAHYQEVVNRLRGRIDFVQVGARRAWHPPLEGVVDLVGGTSLRQLIHLVHHAEGVLCPITALMHLAAAVPAREDSPFKLRPCVVLAGGRENPHFIGYPMHRVMHTVGMLPCCVSGGCGMNGFGAEQCPFPERAGEHETVPRCMNLITPADVVAAIEFYYRGSARLSRSA
jgi:hypothetical protein